MPLLRCAYDSQDPIPFPLAAASAAEHSHFLQTIYEVLVHKAGTFSHAQRLTRFSSLLTSNLSRSMKLRELFAILTVILMGASRAVPLDEGISLLQDRKFTDAAAALETVAGERVDYARYLRALALFYAGKHAEAEAVCDGFLREHEKSVWLRKVRFVKAKALIAQGKHEQAEKIYSEEAHRLFSRLRKEEIAGTLIAYADELSREPEVGELDAPPANDAKALELYKKVLEMNIGHAMREGIQFKVAQSHGKLDQHDAAIAALRDYLDEFDPAWTGRVGSAERLRGQAKENPGEAGANRFGARLLLARTQLKKGDRDAARQNAQDLIEITPADAPDAAKLLSECRWITAQSFRATGDELNRRVSALRDFLKENPADPKAPEASRLIARSYGSAFRIEDAVAAYRDFIDGNNFSFIADERSTTPDGKTGISPAQQLEDWQQAAHHTVGQLLFNQKKYEEAIAQWQGYIVRWPNGAQWASSQNGIINAEFHMGLDAVAANEEELAQERFDAFLKRYPLDHRARQIMFMMGQIHYSKAGELEREENASPELISAHYRQAIEEWARLISKYPNTEESSLALYRTGVIQSEKLGQLEEGLSTFKRLTWGSWAQPAKGRVALLSEKSLGLATERTFRTNEQPTVRVTARNIEKLKLSRYGLDLEAYFRKTHHLGRVDALDVDLIEPDETWEVELAGYEKYRLIEQEIPIPFEGGKPGVCIVKIEGDDWEATTLVIRSDIDLILKSSKREVLVFAEDRRRGKPAAGTELLLSDGKKVFAVGKTGEDGVYRSRFDELESLPDLRAFAKSQAGMATNMVPLGFLSLGSGLQRRGYIYTEKTAYQPGEHVRFRGIIRHVSEGSYTVPQSQTYTVRISDNAGRLLKAFEVELNEFGSFVGEVQLPFGAALGRCAITVFNQREKEDTYHGQFIVQEFKLEQIRLAFDFPQKVYFRGENVRGTVTANYYWGTPAAGKLVQLALPDGRQITRKTGADGKLAFDFDTSGFQPGRPLHFGASLGALNITENSSIFLAELGYSVRLKPAQPLALAGEPFEVTVKTRGADGREVGKELTITVLRRQIQKSNRVLEAVPWINYSPPPGAEVTVEEHRVLTDPEDGEATLTLKLEQGGLYVLRASGEDRFGQAVTGQTSVKISDDEDANKLRFFAEKATYEVGTRLPLSLHSRIDAKLALVTFEGEEIIEHRVVPLAKGYNPIDLEVGHAHFPNFRVSVALMDGKLLRSAAKDFRVTRELNIAIHPQKEIYAPGESGAIEVEVTDQLGRPVEAELSLALVNEALHTLFPDQTPNIKGFFQAGTHRQLDTSVHSTCAFAYSAKSQRRVDQTVLLTANPVEQTIHVQRQELGLNATNSTLVTGLRSNFGSVLNNEISYVDFNSPTLANLGDNAFFYRNGNMMAYADDSGVVGQAGGGVLGAAGMAGNILAGEARDASHGATQPVGHIMQAPETGALELYEEDLRGLDNTRSVGDLRGAGARSSAEALSGVAFTAHGQSLPATGGGAARFLGRRDPGGSRSAEDIQSTTLWMAPVVTDKQGKGAVTLTLPRTAAQWRIVARGCSRETLVGQADAKVITRKELFVDLRLPETLQEGDTIELLATIHNLTDYEGEATAVLEVEGADAPYRSEKRVAIGRGTREISFDPFSVPFVEVLRFEFHLSAGEREDAGWREVTVRPWGIEYADYAGGVTSTGAGILLELPKGQTYTGRKLYLGLSPSIEQALIDLALQRSAPLSAIVGSGLACRLSPQTETLSSSLLAAASALHYARDRKAADHELEELAERVKALAASLVVSQRKNGSWSWNTARKGSDLVPTATAYWGLILAREAGIEVQLNVFEKAEKHFRDATPRLAANDTEGKALLLHALSVSGKADFSTANRLYRERASLNEPALAYLSAAFIRMGRSTFARELLNLLEHKSSRVENGGTDRKLVYWKGGTQHALLRDRTETTAMALWCYAKLRRDSKIAASAAEYLLAHAGIRGRSSNRALGASVAALAQYYSKGTRPGDDYQIHILVNGESAGVVKSADLRGTRYYWVPPKGIKAGRNTLQLEVKGRGEIRYAATLSGFSPDLKDPKSFSTSRFHSRAYYHDKLSYRDVPLKAHSTSPVKQLELGQRIRAHVRMDTSRHSRYLTWEENLPAGLLLVADSLQGNFDRVEYRGSKIVLSFNPGYVSDLSYELVAHSPGRYRVLPSVLRDASDHGLMRVGQPGELFVLRPGAESEDKYEMNHHEHFELATALFKDGKFSQAQKHLDVLFQNPAHRKPYERDLARMLLWIHTGRDQIDAQRIVDLFEILRERHPDLVIPFDKILRVGEAYRMIGEYERAWLVFRATIGSSFLNDSNLSAVLEDQNQFLAAIEYQEKLWQDYPDGAEAVSAYFALSQSLFAKAPEAGSLEVRPGEEKLQPAALYGRSKTLLESFLTLYPNDPLSDDAAFSLTNAFFSLKDYAGVVEVAETFSNRFPESTFKTSFQYMAALGHFWQRHYAEALRSAAVVAQGESKDRDYARYITAQIYHAQGEPTEAMDWYEKVRNTFPDAGDSIDYFRQQRISMPEVSTFKPGEPIELKIDYRNIKAAALQVYKVDLMKLYLREKNLSHITQVNLAGIKPETDLSIALGDGKDYRPKEHNARLPMTEEGAYLVICRGDDLFTSGLVLVTPLRLEVQEDAPAGSVRVNVLNSVEGGYVAEAEVKAIGSHNQDFASGITGLRGIFQAVALQGAAAVIAKSGVSQYAFYRGTTHLGAAAGVSADSAPTDRTREDGESRLRQLDQQEYLKNLDIENTRMQSHIIGDWDAQRRSKGLQGVEVRRAH